MIQYVSTVLTCSTIMWYKSFLLLLLQSVLSVQTKVHAVIRSGESFMQHFFKPAVKCCKNGGFISVLGVICDLRQLKA